MLWWLKQEMQLFNIFVVGQLRRTLTGEWPIEWQCQYRQTCNISRTKSQNLDVSRLVLQVSLSNPLEPGVKSSMKM